MFDFPFYTAHGTLGVLCTIALCRGRGVALAHVKRFYYFCEKYRRNEIAPYEKERVVRTHDSLF